MENTRGLILAREPTYSGYTYMIMLWIAVHNGELHDSVLEFSAAVFSGTLCSVLYRCSWNVTMCSYFETELSRKNRMYWRSRFLPLCAVQREQIGQQLITCVCAMCDYREPMVLLIHFGIIVTGRVSCKHNCIMFIVHVRCDQVHAYSMESFAVPKPPIFESAAFPVPIRSKTIQNVPSGKPSSTVRKLKTPVRYDGIAIICSLEFSIKNPR